MKNNTASDNLAVISTQQLRLKDGVGKFLGKGEKYAMIDFPNHSNVGDSAIWVGAFKLLKDISGLSPSYVSMVENFDADELCRAVPTGPIFLHGGGNFGDIWPKHQLFREMIFKKFPKRLVIQLPQSIKFSDQGSIARCAAAIASHENLHLMVRDEESFDLASREFHCGIYLMPDTAFAMGQLARPVEAESAVFMLLRTDAERADYDWSTLKELDTFTSGDWLIEPKEFERSSLNVARVKSFANLSFDAQSRRLNFYNEVAMGRVKRGLLQLSGGRKVITDRLHAHILCTLLGIPHVVLDNNYGKISRYINSWTSNYKGVRKATSVVDAVEKLKQF